jgi:hypothetical protein
MKDGGSLKVKKGHITYCESPMVCALKLLHTWLVGEEM